MSDLRLVLASGSPRRRALLDQVGLLHGVRAPDVDEALPPEMPVEERVRRLAERKATAVPIEPSEWVLGADTLGVDADGRVLGKPRGEEDAVRMLLGLGGREHRVLTGICVVRGRDGARFGRVVETRVRFARLSREQAEAYVATGEPLGKAGAYAIQGLGAALVAHLEGDYANVVGLPLRATVEALHAAGFPLPAHLSPEGT